MTKLVIVAATVLALSLVELAHAGLGDFANGLPTLRRPTTGDHSRLDGGSSSGVAKGDFNGDGFADLAIGVPHEATGGAADAGAVNVIYGSADGLVAPASAGPTTPKAQFITQEDEGVSGGSERGDHFGAALAAGDFNDDGKSDLAIGIPGEDLLVDGFNQTDVGRIVVIYGSDKGLVTSGSVAVHAPQSFDLLNGRDSSLLSEHLGASLAWGDFNGDSIADLAIGVPDFTPPSLTIFAQPSAGAVWVLFGQKDNGLVLTGNQLWTQEDTGEGSSNTRDLFGFSLAGGDFDGDKVSDLAIGVPNEDIEIGFLNSATNAGRVVVLYGVSGTGLSKSHAQSWSQASEGIVSDPLKDEDFGFSLAAGDFNGDKKDDLAIGVPGQSVREIVIFAAGTRNVTPSGGKSAGAVHILPGSSSRLTATNGQFWTQDLIFGAGGSEPGDQFGRALAAGDFNADGKLDLAIGVPKENVGTTTDAGEVDVIYGSSAGLSPTTVRGPQALRDTPLERKAEFGRSLTAWNFGRNETRVLPPDNFTVTIVTADLAVGVPLKNVSGKKDAGEVKVFYGSAADDGLTTSDTQIWTQATPNVPGSPEARDNFGAALY